MRVAIDSNALTYLIQAMEPGYDPMQDNPALASERLAMIRCYLYAEQYFYVLPEVEREYQQITGKDWRQTHETVVTTLLLEVCWPLDPATITQRADAFLRCYGKISDCRALAEAESAGMSVFLTRDDKFMRRLAPLTKLRMVSPSAFWETFAIRPRTQPRLSPHPTNPLSRVAWWRI
jgi:hypothetical protein